eukprot:9112906-Heterocapsa_arctica.AAC.1
MNGAATSLCAVVASVVFSLGIAKDVPPELYSEASTGVVDTTVRSAQGRRSSASNSAMRCLSSMSSISSSGGGQGSPEAIVGV